MVLKINGDFLIIDKETKTGTNAKGDWSINEYKIVSESEAFNGDIIKTTLMATINNNMPELEVMSKWNLTLVVNSREHNGKHYPSFRVINAKLLGIQEVKVEDKQKDSELPHEELNDNIPF